MSRLRAARQSIRSSNARHLLNGLGIHLVADRDGLLQHLELPHDSDQPHGRPGHGHIGLFDLALLHFHDGGNRGAIVGIGVLKAGVTHFLQRVRRRKIYHLDLTQGADLLLHRAVSGYLDWLSGGYVDGIARRVLQRVLSCDREFTRWQHLQAAVTRIERTVGSSHHKKTLAGQRLLLGDPAAFSLGAVGLIFALIGIEFGLFVPNFLQALPERVYGVMSNDTLLAIPVFTFMGLVLERSGMAEDLLRSEEHTSE